MQQAHQLSEWLIAHLDELKLKAKEVSQHCKLQSVEPWFIGTGTFVIPIILMDTLHLRLLIISSAKSALQNVIFTSHT